ncbi:hypothetical protein F511_26282 [Dorcoceras hygrometricum]|uniref:Uncharacterized protein n=1 Tax=Dorcoceras hygrometricum TaxID=472368 RepID=A0A2Z7D8P2_9LAMI|nr:hypothetical protein F511_26282 [Dorcoceras hygrometricum]
MFIKIQTYVTVGKAVADPNPVSRRTTLNPPPMLNTLSSVSVRESRIQYLCDPQWFRDTASRGPTTIVAPESQFRTCPSDHGACLRPVSRGNRHFTVGGGRLRQSGPRPEGRLLRQPALEGLTRSARTETPRKVGRNKFRRGKAAAAAARGTGGGREVREEGGGSRTPQNPPQVLNTLSLVSVRESRVQYLCDPQWFRDTASRGPTTIVAPESQFRTCPSDHGFRNEEEYQQEEAYCAKKISSCIFPADGLTRLSSAVGEGQEEPAGTGIEKSAGEIDRRRRFQSQVTVDESVSSRNYKYC